jgi:hypothetical protein
MGSPRAEQSKRHDRVSRVPFPLLQGKKQQKPLFGPRWQVDSPHQVIDSALIFESFRYADEQRNLNRQTEEKFDRTEEPQGNTRDTLERRVQRRINQP